MISLALICLYYIWINTIYFASEAVQEGPGSRALSENSAPPPLPPMKFILIAASRIWKQGWLGFTVSPLIL